MPGPKPKPTRLKLLLGNPGKRPLNRSEPIPPPGVPASPGWLNDAERDEWDRLAPVLWQMGLLTVVDADALAVYVTALARWKKANRELHEQGLLLERKSGGRYVNPLVRVIAQAEAALHRAAAMFGLSPADRQRIEVERAKPVDPLDELLEG